MTAETSKRVEEILEMNDLPDEDEEVRACISDSEL
jgi:hypothetical protein